MKNKYLKEIVDESTWTYKGFHGIMHTFFPVGQTGPASSFLNRKGVKTLFFATGDDYIHWYWNDNDLTNLRNFFLKQIEDKPSYLKELTAQWVKKIKTFKLAMSKIEQVNLSDLSNNGLIALYGNFYKKYLEEFKYFMALGDAISMHADRYLIPDFKELMGKGFDRDFPRLISTHYRSFIEKEKIDRNKLLQRFKSPQDIPISYLEKHAQKYFYINNNYAKGFRLDANYFLNLMIKERSEKERPNKALEEKKKLIKKYSPSSWQKKLIKIMDEFFKIQDERKKYVLMANTYQIEFLQELERRAGINFKYLKYAIFPEIKYILSGQVKAKDLQKRSSGCACLSKDGAYKLIVGREYKELFKHIQGTKKKKLELKGVVASTGKARGKVRRILKTHDMINMEKGDVLVASMTRPEMTSVMKLAAAIITDEGGITSHAAIVSRELKIPCIIGTKIATQILKDGDEVEVDADKGIIRII